MTVFYVALAALTLVMCLFAGPLGGALGIVDVPDGARKIHSRETPLTGGLSIMLPVLIVAAVLARSTDFGPFYTTLAAGLGFFLVLGLIDDHRHIRPIWRLAASAAACFAVLYAVPALEVSFLKFSFLAKPTFLEGTAAVFTVLCLVGLQNAVNMADGKNGLVIGLALIWVLALLLLGPAHLRPLFIVFALGLAIVLPFNLRGFLFLGDSGTYAISMVIGLTTIYAYNVNFATLPADMVVLWFLIPVVDCLRLMVTRVIAGRSPLSPDRNHLHHILWQLMPWPGALAAYLALVAAPGLLAVLQPAWTLLWVVFALSSYFAIIGLNFRGPAARRIMSV